MAPVISEQGIALGSRTFFVCPTYIICRQNAEIARAYFWQIVLLTATLVLPATHNSLTLITAQEHDDRELLWGDEVEYHVVAFDDVAKTVKVTLRFATPTLCGGSAWWWS